VAAYNFQKQFVPLIESGSKRSTIRKRRKNGYIPKAGELLTLYQGMRTKNCKLIRKVIVGKVTPIIINASIGCVDVILNGGRLTDSDIRRLATADGFRSISEFSYFFEHAYGVEFQGYLIEWRLM
jgi:hypothetical protein